MSEWLTGNLEFTEMIPVFNYDIKQWKDKKIIYSYQGYGGDVDYKYIFTDEKIEWIPTYPKFNWEEKEYKATVTKVEKERMYIKLDEHDYEFYLCASDFRHNKLKWQFDIGESD